MALARVISFLLLTCTWVECANAQDASQTPALAPRPPALSDDDVSVMPGAPPTTETVPLIVPKGTAVQVALDKEVRVHKPGFRRSLAITGKPLLSRNGRDRAYREALGRAGATAL